MEGASRRRAGSAGIVARAVERPLSTCGAPKSAARVRVSTRTPSHGLGIFNGALARAPRCVVSLPLHPTPAFKTRVGGTSLYAPWPAGSVTPSRSWVNRQGSGRNCRGCQAMVSNPFARVGFREGVPVGGFSPHRKLPPRAPRLVAEYHGALRRCSLHPVASYAIPVPPLKEAHNQHNLLRIR